MKERKAGNLIIPSADLEAEQLESWCIVDKYAN